MKKFNYLLGSLLAVLLLVTIGPMFRVVYATEETQTETQTETKEATDKNQVVKDRITEKENQLTDAQKEKDQLQSSLTDLEAIKKNLEKSKSNLTEYVKELDGTLMDITTKLQEIENLITTKESEIKETTKNLELAKKQEKEQYEAMKDRIKFMYEKGDASYFELLFNSKSFSEILNKANYVEQFSEYDRDMLALYTETKEMIADCEEQLKLEQEVLVEAQTVAKKEQKSMESLIVEKQVQIESFESDIENKEEAIKQYEDEIASQNAEIAALEAAVANEKASLGGDAINYDGGAFAWPAPSYTKVSSDYGNRMHPTLGVVKFHNGVDLAAPTGTAICAAYNGDVVAAGYSSTMGNYIMIDHGGGLFTIYMHASSLSVSAGTSVTRGQQIATVGSTGRSTGPHLHFGVRLNGNYVSPWNYL